MMTCTIADDIAPNRHNLFAQYARIWRECRPRRGADPLWRGFPGRESRIFVQQTSAPDGVPA